MFVRKFVLLLFVQTPATKETRSLYASSTYKGAAHTRVQTPTTRYILVVSCCGVALYTGLCCHPQHPPPVLSIHYGRYHDTWVAARTDGSWVFLASHCGGGLLVGYCHGQLPTGHCTPGTTDRDDAGSPTPKCTIDQWRDIAQRALSE